ncbi:hypothetical protein Z043_117393, partial [Scleropages formosus]
MEVSNGALTISSRALSGSPLSAQLMDVKSLPGAIRVAVGAEHVSADFVAGFRLVCVSLTLLSLRRRPSEGLKEYFCKFGEVKECMVMRDPVTKRSRGFGFVTYVDQAGVDKVLAQTRHELDSKTIDPKVAFPRRAQPKLVTRTKKIFVGGLSVNTTIEDVKQYFDQFGK